MMLEIRAALAPRLRKHGPGINVEFTMSRPSRMGVIAPLLVFAFALTGCDTITALGNSEVPGIDEGNDDSFDANPHEIDGIFANTMGAFIYFKGSDVKVCVPGVSAQDYDWEWVDENTIEGYGPDGTTLLQYGIEFVHNQELILTPITTAATHNPSTYRSSLVYPCDDGIGLNLRRGFSLFWEEGEGPDHARITFNGSNMTIRSEHPESCDYTLDANDVQSQTDVQRMRWTFEASWSVCIECGFPGGDVRQYFDRTLRFSVDQLHEDPDQCNIVRVAKDMSTTVNP